MSLFRALAKSFVNALIESAQESSTPSPNARETVSDPNNQDRWLRYVGNVNGAAGVVDVHVTRILNQYQDVFRIEGTFTSSLGQLRFDANGHSGMGKLQDETVIKMNISEESLAVTINPFDPPAPTYYFRRS